MGGKQQLWALVIGAMQAGCTALQPGDVVRRDGDAGPPRDGATIDAPDCPAGCCGDGIRDPDEACDDGNLTDGDGCESDCFFTECFPSPTWYLDCDGDGYVIEQVEQCNEPDPVECRWTLAPPVGADPDCNDRCATCHPGATEVCDGEDNDCNGPADEGLLTTFYRDADMDGFGDEANFQDACDVPDGFVGNPDDCNDEHAGASPSGTEGCNGLDDDCNGEVDDVDLVYFEDDDGDGFGNPLVTMPITSCPLPAGYVDNAGDCCDEDLRVFPGQPNFFPDLNSCGDFDYNCSGAPEARRGGGVCCATRTVLNCETRAMEWACCPPMGATCTAHLCGSGPSPFVNNCLWNGSACVALTSPEIQTCH